ncbi:MAG: hydrogenase maturation nickel metallochaperone HypA [Candidatus Neomarinimicrobiota bacterium]
MHELTIVENIINMVEAEIGKRQLDQKISKIVFLAGKMNAIIPESLTFGFDTIKKEHPVLADAELVIRILPITVRCRSCGAESTIDEPEFICQHCSGTEIEMLTGSEMFIESIEMDEE